VSGFAAAMRPFVRLLWPLVVSSSCHNRLRFNDHAQIYPTQFYLTVSLTDVRVFGNKRQS